MESARYQHALETELARTIASLQNVQGARVHLAMARQSAFVQRAPAGLARRCSCRSRPGRRLDDEQVQAIANLVASSIPGARSLAGHRGRPGGPPAVRARRPTAITAMRDKMFEFAHRLEERYTQRIQEMLTPLVGPGRVRAQVVAQVDMATTEADARAVSTRRARWCAANPTAEEAARNGAGAAGGVPGALTNQPPQPGVALPPGATPAVAQSGANPAGAAAASAA